MTIQPTETGTIEPGTDAWRVLVTASKVPAILGVSPYSDAYTEFHHMKGNLPPFGGNSATERGRYLEPAILAWFADQHPEYTVEPNTQTVFHEAEAAWAATPDGYAYDNHTAYTDGVTPALVECKSYKYSDGFGKPGTADVPAHVLAQVIFQMIVTRATKAHVACMFGDSFDFAEYVIEWDSDVALMARGIANAIRAFQARLDRDDAPAPTGPAAYDAARALHPGITAKVEANVPDAVAIEYIAATTEAKAAEAREKVAKAKLADAMGAAQYAIWDGTKIASRMSKNGGTPYVQAAKNLPLPLKETAA